ncbi:MAG: DUF1801 domain-containing protein [Phaeodactylibacter sp.]|nr:DUF1801 domain-containing protein [Phaeodactylibacter sp.]MCB9052713.1 DUF1801 domain-containing protein [Lewinellaceae bacterium]
MDETKFGTFDGLLEITEERLRPIASALKKMILEIDPGACEVVRLGDRAATYGVGPKKMSEGYAYILPYQSWVNLGFYKGAALDDPYSLLEGTGKNLRHIKMRSVEDTGRPGVEALIRQALEERKKVLNR